MLILILAFLGGMLTILSPCILPVLLFVFARSDRPFMRSGLPMLLGMALTFAAVATLAALGGGWAVHANQYGRIAALVMLAMLGLTLLWTHLAQWLARPFVALGNTLSRGSPGEQDSIASAVGLGVATGLLWAPCAGPIRFRVQLEGQPQGTDYRMDTAAQGNGVVTSQRLYQLVRQASGSGERTFDIEFFDPGVQAYAFTFG